MLVISLIAAIIMMTMKTTATSTMTTKTTTTMMMITSYFVCRAILQKSELKSRKWGRVFTTIITLKRLIF